MTSYYLIKNGKRISKFDTWAEAYEVCHPLYATQPEGTYYGIETVKS